MVKKIAYRAGDGKPRTLEYTLVRSARKTIGIIVDPNGKVTVRVPQFMPDWKERKREFERIYARRMIT
ncbi:MAG: hypothetical protein WC914_02910 [Proteiniphilum sp.]